MGDEEVKNQPSCWVVYSDRYSDGSGTTEILGVFFDETSAQACAWRSCVKAGDFTPFRIEKVVLPDNVQIKSNIITLPFS